MGGRALLSALERELAGKVRRYAAYEGAESLKAFLGSRGIKASTLNSDDDFWLVASILWPHTVRKGRTGTLAELHSLIRNMTKKSRRTASVNLQRVPERFLPSHKPAVRKGE